MSSGQRPPMDLRCAKCKRFSRARTFLERCPMCGSPRMTRIEGNPDIKRGGRGNRGSKFAAERDRRARLLLVEKKRKADERAQRGEP